jgi:hypothetical protein
MTLNAKWLKTAQTIVNDDPDFRKLGSTDVNMALKVGKNMFLVKFAAFRCQSVSKIKASEKRDADFVAEFSEDAWQQFLSGRHDGTGASLVDLDTTDSVIKVDNPRDRLEFLRYHLSVQAFLDAGARAA